MPWDTTTLFGIILGLVIIFQERDSRQIGRDRIKFSSAARQDWEPVNPLTKPMTFPALWMPSTASEAEKRIHYSDLLGSDDSDRGNIQDTLPSPYFEKLLKRYGGVKLIPKHLLRPMEAYFMEPYDDEPGNIEAEVKEEERNARRSEAKRRRHPTVFYPLSQSPLYAGYPPPPPVPYYPGPSYTYATMSTGNMTVSTTIAPTGTSTVTGSTVAASSTGAASSTASTSAPVRNCGLPAITPQRSIIGQKLKGQKIVGGSEAIPHSWPWQVQVSPGQALCGGTIINDQWILTAAHCVVNNGVTLAAADVTVKVAEHDLASPTDGVVMTVQTVVVHPQYNKAVSQNFDVCLLKLGQTLTLTDKIMPACLPEPTRSLETAGTTCYLTGWGTTSSGGSISNVLLQVATVIIDQATCAANYVGEGTIITDQMICAAAPGKDSCQGDSGGPLVCQDPATQLWTLIGATSFGIGCADPLFPGVAARVSALLGFITGTITANG